MEKLQLSICSDAALEKLKLLIPFFATAAQAVYDEWEQDENGCDPYIGTGGICDFISQAIGNVLVEHGHDVIDGGQDGDDHSYCIAIVYDNGYDRYFAVDIPYSVYEVGGGYSWTKIPGVAITGSDIVIEEVDLG